MKGAFIMPFVMGQCPECKKILPVDDTQEKWVCSYCNAEFPVSLAVSKFNESGRNYENVADSIAPVSRKSDFVIVCGVVKEYRGESRNIVIPEGVVEISRGAFKDMPVKSIVIPESIDVIDNNLGFHNSLESLTIHSGVIDAEAFKNFTYLKSANIYSKCITDKAFYDCNSLKSIMLSEGVTYIGDYAFSGCSSLESVTIPERVKSIGKRAFSTCIALKSLIISENVESIGEQAFVNCHSLESVTIPESVKSIGNGAFYACSSLKYVKVPKSADISDNAFASCPNVEIEYY